MDHVRKSVLEYGEFMFVFYCQLATQILKSFKLIQGVVPLSEQIKQFAAIKKNLTAIRGSSATEAFFNKSIFCISIGSNDFFRYLNSNTSILPQQLLGLLIKAYEAHIKVKTIITISF